MQHSAVLLKNCTSLMQWQTQADKRAASMHALMFCCNTQCWHDLLVPEADAAAVARAWPAAQEQNSSATHRLSALSQGEQSSGKQAETCAQHCRPHCTSVHAASWMPFLWGMCASSNDLQAQHNTFDANAIVGSMQQSGLVSDTGLLQTTLCHSGQQWDAPNCWPPLLCMWVDGLVEYGGDAGVSLAARLSRAFVQAVQQSMQASGVAWEKYACSGQGAAGGGGEYEVQPGFGWTNGTALHMIVQHEALQS